MGSNNYFGEPNMGGGGGGGGSSSSGSSRKGKKANSEKAKQPQRGLGVAQLEKIRLHGQVGPFINPYPTSGFITNQMEETRVQAAAAYASTFASRQSSSSPAASYGYHPNIMMGHGEYDQRASMIYGDHSSLPSAMLEPTQQFIQPGLATRQHQFLNPQEGFHQTRGKKHRSNSMGSIGQNSESSDSQEVDLELRLSL